MSCYSLKYIILTCICFSFLSVSCSSSRDIDYSSVPSSDLNSDNGDSYRIVGSLAYLKGGQKALQSKLVYPQKAKEDGIETTLVADVLINKKGMVEQITFEKKAGYGFEEAAINAINAVSFEPGTDLKGNPVRMIISIPVEFKL